MHQHEILAIMRLSSLLLVVAALSARAAAQQVPPVGGSALKPDYYSQSCPRAERIIAEVMQTKQMANPTTAAGMLRVFFHDCFVTGCDASVLIASTQFQKSEHDAEINHSLPGDAFDAVVRAKLALELECPGVVSCADILALASGVLVTMTGGPRYPIPLGRKDSLSSSPTAPDVELPHANFTVDRLIQMFGAKGFTVQELVALSGAHTLGFSHCKEFADRLYNFRSQGGKPEPFDPSMNPSYARGLQDVCKDYLKDPTIAAFNDIMTPGKFDNMYFVNLERGLGLLSTDEELWTDPRTKPLVQLYASNPTAFFTDFGRAMEKLSLFGVKTGADGEVRRRCDAYNSGPDVGGAMPMAMPMPKM
uniref:Peroxidase n=1 Tax=Zea mays TaxID=4577 RepID=B6TYF5_MAIZE|nr:peroxidase 65 precursor [Zea mays]